MANPNNIPQEAVNAWCDEYAALCKRHGLYLVANDEVWLQSAGEPLDAEEACENMRRDLIDALGPNVGAKAPTAVGSNDELGAFFTAAQLQAATMTELAGMRAKRGFCPKCQAQKLRHVSSGGGLVYRQCADCGTAAVLGA